MQLDWNGQVTELHENEKREKRKEGLEAAPVHSPLKDLNILNIKIEN